MKRSSRSKWFSHDTQNERHCNIGMIPSLFICKVIDVREFIEIISSRNCTLFWQIIATSLLGIIAVRVTADTSGKFF